MQRTSNSIGALAAALAKAQAELVNPEKSLTATIRAEESGGDGQTFRYAPLSSGLDIVRKTLGQHEIATVQTTSIDQAAGIINLTTVLAHASGEWIASDWPVCPISETATPHRMGAALTYARRYALFTLVGIAGEDDLDAPDLSMPTTETSEPANPSRAKPNGGGWSDARAGTAAPRQPAKDSSAKPILTPEQSAALCDELITEINSLTSSDDAAIWVQHALLQKNRLTGLEAQRVENVFQTKLATLIALSRATSSHENARSVMVTGSNGEKPSARARQKVIDKTALALPEPRRIRDREHVKSVMRHACLICGRIPSDAHHLRFAQSQALGRRVSDEFIVPLCRGHHRELHRCGDEQGWWTKVGLDPAAAARTLWLKTHPLPQASENKANLDPTDPFAALKAGHLLRD